MPEQVGKQAVSLQGGMELLAMFPWTALSVFSKVSMQCARKKYKNKMQTTSTSNLCNVPGIKLNWAVFPCVHKIDLVAVQLT